ncbi:MAG: right-handed parallel beta-helix repeat-containing protein, partial [Clostridia bacterium]|nr:right-handed parallel beta-helix repeat-containing protein [Clostridia bacterium]
YYAIPESGYEVCTDKYLVAHKGNTILVKIEIGVTEIGAKADLEGSFELNLYTEDGLPADFEYDKEYSVVDGVAYVKELCPTCASTHKTAVAMEEGTYEIATPTTAQQVLDSDINGKVVIFDGEFKDELVLRTTAESYSDVINGGAVDSELNEIINNDYELLKTYTTTSFSYRRVFEDIKFVATDDSYFEGKFIARSTWHADDTYDPVKGFISKGHSQVIVLNNVKFENLNFVGATGRLSFFMHLGKSENLVINNCSFTTDEIESSNNVENAAIMITTTSTGEAKNSTFTNNRIDGHAMGIYIANGDTVTIQGNAIKNTRHNGIAVQYTDNKTLTGIILIENNNVSNCLDQVSKTETDPNVWAENGERAMRIGFAKDATIIIRNNQFNNTYKQVFAGISGENNYVNTNIRIYNNYYDDIKLDHFIETDELFIISWTE